MKLKYIIGIGVIILFMFFAGASFQRSLTPYVSFQEAMKKGTTVQIKGARVEGSEKFDAEQKTFNFVLADHDGIRFQVVYNGVKPSNFEHAREVVAKGRYHDGQFQADEILIKCPSKYEAEAINNTASM